MRELSGPRKEAHPASDSFQVLNQKTRNLGTT